MSTGPSRPILRSENTILLASILLYVLLSNVPPYGRYFLYPFELLATWFHEMSHGFMAWALGGRFVELKLFPDTSGVAMNAMPKGVLKETAVASAGYLGSSLAGSILIVLSRKARAARPVVGLLALSLGLSAAFFVRNLFGLAAVLAWALLLAVFCVRFSSRVASFVLNLLAGMVSLNALADIRNLYSANLVVDGKPYGLSDAQAVAHLLYLPSWFWATVWLAVSVLLFLIATWLFRVKPALE
jgi:hypothetical protein